VWKRSPRIARSQLLSPLEAQSLRRATPYDRTVPGIGNASRVFAVPVVTRAGRLVVVAVGASLQDRRNELVQLAATLAIASTAALILISLGAWLALASALRPVSPMRRQAADIQAADTWRRLSLAGGNDEIALVGVTLNQMLDRIEESVASERRRVDRASHELRTPLAIQRIDLDVALSGPQTVTELTDALASVSQENAHLIDVRRIVAYVRLRPPWSATPPSDSAATPGQQASVRPELSCGLIHSRTGLFTGGHPDRVRAARGRWRTPVNAMQHC